MENGQQQKSKGGRPPLFNSPEEMQVAIDRYFNETTSKVITKTGVDYIDGPFTMTGLALALGFSSRQSLYEYEEHEQYADTVSRARARVIAYAEGRLYDRDGAMGAKFALSNYKDGWAERSEQIVSGTVQLEMPPRERIAEAAQRLATGLPDAVTVPFEPVS